MLWWAETGVGLQLTMSSTAGPAEKAGVSTGGPAGTSISSPS
jgi:hypothetical protein